MSLWLIVKNPACTNCSRTNWNDRAVRIPIRWLTCKKQSNVCVCDRVMYDQPARRLIVSHQEPLEWRCCPHWHGTSSLSAGCGSSCTKLKFSNDADEWRSCPWEPSPTRVDSYSAAAAAVVNDAREDAATSLDAFVRTEPPVFSCRWNKMRWTWSPERLNACMRNKLHVFGTFHRCHWNSVLDKSLTVIKAIDYPDHRHVCGILLRFTNNIRHRDKPRLFVSKTFPSGAIEMLMPLSGIRVSLTTEMVQEYVLIVRKNIQEHGTWLGQFLVLLLRHRFNKPKPRGWEWYNKMVTCMCSFRVFSLL